MKILHLFSNDKFTGPADPALLSAEAARRAGLQVRIAIGRPRAMPGPDGPDTLRAIACARGLETIEDLALGKHRRIFRDRRDARRLRQLLASGGADILHAHLANDHRIAERARGGLPLVRTVWAGHPAALAAGEARILRRADAIIAPTEASADALASRLGIPRDRIETIPPPLDLARLDPGRARSDLRPALGVGPGDFVVGIAARMQRHRRFDLLLEAVRRAAPRAPAFRLVVLGRGTRAEEVARRPARAMGLDGVIRFPGYIEGDGYVDALAALDAAALLVPGTDGTCRAIREAMAMGKPAIVLARGILPDLVRDGETGLVVGEDPEALAGAFVRLASDRALAARLGHAAREAARASDLAAVGERLRAVYARVAAAT
ncbi:MAG: glycosyltransferase family 4 protein [Planctomycetes bacterium]|nr:glycosyltransferase family 4 protein [Planctomycetota bacterium]